MSKKKKSSLKRGVWQKQRQLLKKSRVKNYISNTFNHSQFINTSLNNGKLKI